MGQRKIKHKHIVIVGAGTTGIMLANNLARSHHNVTVVDPAVIHYYQPGFLFVPFGMYHVRQLGKPLAKLLRRRVKHVRDVAVSVQPKAKTLQLETGEVLSYDVLVIATGTQTNPTKTEGLVGYGWRKTIHDYYTPDGAEVLRQKLNEFQGGNLVVQVMDVPIKCAVAPLEFVLLADEFFKKRQCRDKVKITYVTPMSSAFTQPIAAHKLNHILTDRSIEVVADFQTEKVDQTAQKVICYDGREVPYDLLVCIPRNVGAKYLEGTGLVNDEGFVKVNCRSLQSLAYPYIFAIGDAADIPMGKTGSVGHAEARTLGRNIKAYLAGRPVEETFDGHSNCFIECGAGRAMLLDFNYDTQPCEGTFPIAGVGPMKLLGPSRINHWAKLAFRWVYWHRLLSGRAIPFLPERMSMVGKRMPPELASVAAPKLASAEKTNKIDSNPNGNHNRASKDKTAKGGRKTP
ncbi:oxidoreductase [Candidatus Saccharibacteria bacterium]|nr:MAG: oxidoreductase [Candidatus Saccharibacteria bacterium]